jgi:arylsulfatase A-like enzyme
MISVLDDAVGKALAALEKKGMRDDTLIVFHSDNGGVRSSMFAGDTKVSGGLPANNGPYRDGKGTLYEGGTRVAAFANWPGKIKAGDIDGMIHVVGLYPTLAGVAGAQLGKNKPLDGMDVWATVSEGKPSPRTEVVYNIDPMAGGVRHGDWKLVWKAALPQSLELFNIAEDKSETTDLAAKNPDKLKELQARVSELAGQMAPPLLLMEAVKLIFYAPPVTGDPGILFGQGD